MSRTYSVFFPSDSDMFDVMSCYERKVSITYLYNLLLSRGILVSKSDSREDLISFASSLNYNYKQFKDISAHVAKTSRKEKTSSVEVNCTVSELDLSEIAASLKNQFGNKPQEKYSSTSSNIQDTIRIDIEYDDIDHSKTRLIQKMRKEAFIEIDKSAGSVKIRYTANEKIASRVSEVIQIIGKKLNEPKLEKREIDFSQVSDKLKITTFFQKLVNDTEGFKLHDVSSIRFHKPKNEAALALPEDGSDEGLDEPDSDTNDGTILRASFLGGALLSSSDCRGFLSRGYYISKIRWISESLTDHIRVVMEAELDNPTECKGYKYHVLGHFKPKDQDCDLYTASYQSLSSSETKEVEKKIESSSYRIYDKLINGSEDSK